MITFSQFAATHLRDKRGFYPRIQLADGCSFSCQASAHHDSLPKQTYQEAPLGVYDEFEVFFENWMLDHRYLVSWITNDTILSYVPKAVINRMVEDHGGIDDLSWLRPALEKAVTDGFQIN